MERVSRGYLPPILRLLKAEGLLCDILGDCGKEDWAEQEYKKETKWESSKLLGSGARVSCHRSFESRGSRAVFRRQTTRNEQNLEDDRRMMG